MFNKDILGLRGPVLALVWRNEAPRACRRLRRRETKEVNRSFAENKK